jgi:heat shock protein HslJ
LCQHGLSPTSDALQGLSLLPDLGSYQYDLSQRKMSFDVRAQHLSCDKALAQEADLMDAMQRIERFQIEGTNLYLLDAKGQRLIQAQSKK